MSHPAVLPVRPLPPRRVPLIEVAACRAALYATRLWDSYGQRSPIPATAWTGRPDGTAEAALDDHTVVVHAPGHAFAPLSIRITCRHGYLHHSPIHAPADIQAARTTAHRCPGHDRQPAAIAQYSDRPTNLVLLPAPNLHRLASGTPTAS